MADSEVSTIFPSQVMFSAGVIGRLKSSHATTAIYTVVGYTVGLEVVGGCLTVVHPKWAVAKYREVSILEDIYNPPVHKTIKSRS